MRLDPKNRLWLGVGGIVLALTLGAAAAFGGNSDNSVVGQAKAAVAKAEAPAGTYTLPASGPKAVKGKTVYAVVCGISIYACVQPAYALQEAAKTLGWNVKIIDGKLGPTGYDAGIRQAIAAKADGIMLVAVDCPNATGALKAAQTAKIPVVGVYAFDCSGPPVNGPSLYTATNGNVYGSSQKWGYASGQLRAQYAIASTDGKANAIVLGQPEFIPPYWWAKGFTETFTKCTTCKIAETVNFTAADLSGGNSPQKLSSALLRNPNANVLWVTSDALLTVILPALRAAHRTNLEVISGEGFPATQDLIRKGVVAAAVGTYSQWQGYAGADALNRIFAGEKNVSAVNEGLGYHLITKQNLGAKDWSPPINYRAAFQSIWTTGKSG